ncbi:hypothetical protein CFC21_016743 [Triticum aestivum]|uniref:AB hydrolase-1 domain-containing protein n=3 Tax=Triticum TaxID=4564 RepID=A0A9R0XFU1_TRITD|nr:2-hydroxy-6-oxononadienedioate/2-hydroxy-6-oxononatrienedioate hydrolase-like [Triticum aestivum]KAF7000982.1 hypothetical protein CFC21_016743 [Triticum aestivum]VAI35961.1 unnamed protein product [Triticum turgidum subsp. durum]
MVNWVQVVREHLVARLATNAGLRQHAVAVDDDAGTVLSFWLPQHKMARSGAAAADQREKQTTSRHAVVLLHGFAGDGMMTWGFQVGALAGCGYDVYVPDLVHFGGSTSPSPDRSVAFQARCLAAALRKLDVGAGCTVVGFSYGGFVAFEMAAVHPGLVGSVVVSGADVAYTGAMNDAMLEKFGAGTLAELLLPDSVARLRSLFSDAMYKKLWFPDRLLSDFLKVMYANRQERKEMLEKLVMMDKQESAPVFQQNILMLWGEDDDFFPIENAKMLKEKLGEKAMLRSISKAGHLAQLERPCVYNHCLKEFLANVNAISPKT